MKSKLVWASERTFVLVLDRGDEALSAIAHFAAEAGLNAASLTAIGAFARATVGWFDLKRRCYRPIAIDQQCEALSLIGDIALRRRRRAQPACARGAGPQRRHERAAAICCGRACSRRWR